MIGAIIAQKVAAQAHQAVNNHDLAGFFSNVRDDGVIVYPGEIWPSCTFSGKAAVEELFRELFAQYPMIQSDIQQICMKNIFVMSGTNGVAVHWNLHLTNREGRVDKNGGVSVITLRGGKINRDKTFFNMNENYRLNERDRTSDICRACRGVAHNRLRPVFTS